MRAAPASLLLLVCTAARAEEAPDPWIQADSIMAARGLEQAIANAEHTRAPPALLKHLRARPPLQKEARAAFAGAQRAYLAGKLSAAIDALEGVRFESGSILAGRVHRLRYLCLAGSRRWKEAGAAARALHGVARTLAWTRGQVSALHFAAHALQAQFDYKGLAQLYEELAAVEAARGNEGGRVVAELNRAGALIELGRVRAARASLDAILGEVRTHGCAEHEIGVLQGLAFANLRLADYGAALVALDRAAALIGTDDAGEPRVQNLVLRGAILEELGEFGRATEVYERAQQLLGAGISPSHADLLGNLGNVSWRRGEYERALKYMEAARKQFQSLGDALRVATTRRGTAEVLTSMGRYDEALTSLAGAAKGFKGHSVQLAETHAYRAHARLAQGNLEEAARALDAAFALDVGDEDRRTASWMHELRGRLHLARNEPTAALAQLRKAAFILDAVVAGLADEETFRAREQRARLFALYTRTALRTGAPGLALAALERGRASALRDAMGGRAALRTVAVPAALRIAVREAEDDVTAAATLLAAARGRGNLKEIAGAQAAREKALQAHRAIEARVEREAKRLAEVASPNTPTLADVQRRLRDDEAFVFYADDDALVILPKTARLVRLAPGNDGTPELHAALSAPDTRESAWRAGLKDMRRRVVAPLALDTTTRRVYVSPDAGRSYLPWPALFAPRQVACVPSAATLALLASQRGLRGTGVLALGDPDYATKAPAARTRGWDLTPLPASRGEVHAIKRLAPGKSTVLLGRDASEAALRRAIGRRHRWRAIHLACHGIVDRERPRRSALALAADATHDGFLSAPEIFGLDLRCDAVVLSACETGRDRYVAAEGVAGLLRAFMAAGAPRVVVSLWKVDDAATRQLMEVFYRRWLIAGDAPARALQAAQAALSGTKEWSHPHYWAAWVLWGVADDAP